MLINPLQMAVMAARLATGRQLMPNFIFGAQRPAPASVGVNEEHLVTIRDAMSAVVNGGGTGGAARIPLPGVLMAGQTGTAQVRDRKIVGSGQSVSVGVDLGGRRIIKKKKVQPTKSNNR